MSARGSLSGRSTQQLFSSAPPPQQQQQQQQPVASSVEGSEVEIEPEHVIGYSSRTQHTVLFHPMDANRILYPMGPLLVNASLTDSHDQLFLRGHDGDVVVVAASAQRFLASGQAECSTAKGRNSQIIVWDLLPPVAAAQQQPSAPRIVFSLQGHTLGISAMAWSPDERFLASTGRDGKLCVWDMETGQCAGGLKIAEPASFLRFVPVQSGSRSRPVYAFAAGFPNQVRVFTWSFDVKSMQFSLSSSPCAVPGAGVGAGFLRNYLCGGVDASSGFILAGTHVGELAVYSIQNLVYRTCVPVVSNGLTALCCSQTLHHGLNIVFVAGGDGSVKKLRGADQRWEVLAEARLGARVVSLCLGAVNGEGIELELLAGCADGCVYRLLTSDLSFSMVMEGHIGSVLRVSFARSRSDLMATCSADGTIRVWDLNTYTCQAVLTPQESGSQAYPLCLQLVEPATGGPSNVLESVISGWSDGFIRCHDAAPQGLSGPRTALPAKRVLWQVVNAHRGPVSAIAVVDQFIVSAGLQDCHVRLWSRRTHEMLAQFAEHTKAVTDVCRDVRPGKELLVYSIGADRHLFGYDLVRERRVIHHSCGESSYLAMAQRRDHDAEFLVATQDGRVLQIDEDIPNKPTLVFPASLASSMAVRAMSLSSSGRFLATVGDDIHLRLFRVPENATGPFTLLVDVETSHSQSVLSVRWSPDDRQVVTVGADAAICIWNAY